jgi:hypothetical protein
MSKRDLSIGKLVLLLPFAAVACSSTSNDLNVQSKFAYPNGDYTFLGHVTAEKKVFSSSFNAPVMSREVFLDLQKQALAQQPGADFIVNYVVSSTTTQVPPLPIEWSTFKLEGTALKVVEVGRQKYDGGGIPTQTRTQ